MGKKMHATATEAPVQDEANVSEQTTPATDGAAETASASDHTPETTPATEQAAEVLNT